MTGRFGRALARTAPSPGSTVRTVHSCSIWKVAPAPSVLSSGASSAVVSWFLRLYTTACYRELAGATESPAKQAVDHKHLPNARNHIRKMWLNDGNKRHNTIAWKWYCRSTESSLPSSFWLLLWIEHNKNLMMVLHYCRSLLLNWRSVPLNLSL
jgi:hypothetical protein